MSRTNNKPNLFAIFVQEGFGSENRIKITAPRSKGFYITKLCLLDWECLKRIDYMDQVECRLIDLKRIEGYERTLEVTSCSGFPATWLCYFWELISRDIRVHHKGNNTHGDRPAWKTEFQNHALIIKKICTILWFSPHSTMFWRKQQNDDDIDINVMGLFQSTWLYCSLHCLYQVGH